MFKRIGGWFRRLWTTIADRLASLPRDKVEQVARIVARYLTGILGTWGALDGELLAVFGAGVAGILVELWWRAWEKRRQSAPVPEPTETGVS